MTKRFSSFLNVSELINEHPEKFSSVLRTSFSVLLLQNKVLSVFGAKQINLI
jgi:hypothetical protein